MGTTTTILGLYKPDIDEVGWGALRNTSYDTLDTAVGTQHTLAGAHRFVEVTNSTGYIKFPELTTVERDALTAAIGMTIYNTTAGQLETYQAGVWEPVITPQLTIEEQDLGPSVTNVNKIVFPNDTITDAGGGVVEVDGFVQHTEGVQPGDMLYFDGVFWSRFAPGAVGQVLQTNGVGAAPTWVSVAGTGNVIAGANLDDNAVVRGDGGGASVQTSGVIIDDSDNVTGIVNLTTTGTVTFNGVTYTFPVADAAGQLTSDGAGNLTWTSVGGGSTFTDDVFRIQDDGDNTRQIAFQASGISPATTRTITMPDSDIDLGDILTNNAKVTNATHTGDVAGSAALTAQPAIITGKGAAAVASGDLLLIADIDDSNNLKQVTAGSIAALGGGGATLTEDITQSTHGFSVGDWLYHNGTIYALADASAAGTAESIGVVSAVAGVDDFTIQFAGRITGLSGLTAGEAHFLSETAGQITATEPTTIGAISKPVLVADSTTSGYIFNMRGSLITAGNDSYREAFTNSDLTAGVLTATHNLNEQFVTVQVYDNNNLAVIPDDIDAVSTTATDIDLSSFGAITGTWNVVIIG